MDRLIIERGYFSECTIGTLKLGDFKCFALELPYMGNLVNVSCIPEGVYAGRLIVSPSLGECIEVADVDGRTYIRIHAGNYTRQIEGCVLVGDSIKFLDGDGTPDITNSRNTLKALIARVKSLDEFEIVIGSNFEV